MESTTLSPLLTYAHQGTKTPRAKFFIFLDAVPTNKNNKIYGNVFEMDKRERDWFIKNLNKDYLLKIGDFSWKERNNG